MPDYGLSDEPDGLLPWSWAVDHLRSAQRFWVSSVDPLCTLDSPQPGRGLGSRLATPHLSAVWAIWLDDALWFSCGPRSRKARNLLANRRCSAATERADEAVTITGHAIRVEVAVSIEPVSAAYLAKYGEGFPDPAENPLFALRPDVVIGMVEIEFSSRATRWTFGAAGVPD